MISFSTAKLIKTLFWTNNKFVFFFNCSNLIFKYELSIFFKPSQELHSQYCYHTIVHVFAPCMTKSMNDVCLKLLQMLHMVLLRGFTYLVHRGGGSRGAWGEHGFQIFPEQKSEQSRKRNILLLPPPPLRICEPSAVSGTYFHCVSSLSQKCNQFLTLFAIFSRFFRRHLFK